MNIYNEPARVERNAEFGHVWVEVSSGAAITIEVPKYSACRVRAAGAVTVSMDSILAATMVSGEILIFNSGRGNVGATGTDTKMTVTLAVTGTAFVQIARNQDAGGRENIVAPG